jgi:hypothetical protein
MGPFQIFSKIHEDIHNFWFIACVVVDTGDTLFTGANDTGDKLSPASLLTARNDTGDYAFPRILSIP